MAIMTAFLHDKSIMSQNDCVLQNDATKQNSEFMELGHRYIYIYIDNELVHHLDFSVIQHGLKFNGGRHVYFPDVDARCFQWSHKCLHQYSETVAS